MAFQEADLDSLERRPMTTHRSTTTAASMRALLARWGASRASGNARDAKRLAVLAAAAAASLSFASANLRAASITEPATVFYGNITGTGSSVPFPVDEGELIWTI